MTLHLDLDSLGDAADNELLRRVPHDLVDYYQALPLAHEEGRVTVVTPHPDNRAAIQVMARVLGAEVLPVTGNEAVVAAAIERLYPVPALDRRVFSWTDDAAWNVRVQAAATLYGGVLGLPVTHLASEMPAPSLLNQLAGTPDALLVCHLSGPQQLAELMQQTSASLLLVRGDHHLPRQVLVALRGFGSDRAALRQARPLLNPTEASVTVLPLAHGQGWEPDRLLVPNGEARLHLDDALAGMGAVPVAIRLRSGSPTDQLIAELAPNTYDLLVIAAEAWGEFVLQTLDSVMAADILPDQPILIVRPPVTWATPEPDTEEPARHKEIRMNHENLN